MESLVKYKVQIKTLKIFNDEGVSPKLFDIVMEQIKDNLDFKSNISLIQEIRNRGSLMKYINQTYGYIACGSIDTKLLEFENTTCLVHRVGFLKIMYHILIGILVK